MSIHKNKQFATYSKVEGWVLAGTIVAHAAVENENDSFILYRVKDALGLIDNKIVKGKFEDKANKFIIDPKTDFFTSGTTEHRLIEAIFK